MKEVLPAAPGPWTRRGAGLAAYQDHLEEGMGIRPSEEIQVVIDQDVLYSIH